MKIRKFFSFVVVTILLSLSVSAISSAAVNTSPVISPLAEPEPYLKTVGDHIEVDVFYVVNRPGNINRLYEYKALYPLNTNIYFCYSINGNRSMQWVSIYSDNDHIDNAYAYSWDIESGSFINQEIVTSDFWSARNLYYCGFRNGYFPRTTGIYAENDFNYGYGIIPDNMPLLDNNYPEELNVTPYVTWSTKPPAHNIYHSQLSEPVADEYNSYFICNDKLYWLSYKVNGLYSFQQNIEVESEVFSESGFYSGSGSGSYAGSQNGYTESFSIAGDLGGSTGSGSVPAGFIGAWKSDPAQIDYVGVSQGSLHTSNNGAVTYNNVQVYPVAYNASIINRFFNACVYLDDNKTFYIRIYPNNDQMASLIVDMDIYLSTFELTDGSYISSTYTNYQGSVLYGGQKFELSDEIVSDVRCYGLQFKNVNNLPVNLSDVLWQYDLEFVQWRSAMLQTLQNIYQILNNGSGTPEAETYYDFAGELQSAEQNYSNLNAQDFNVMLNDALPAGKYDNAASQIKRWISDFSIGELIAVCIFALALGTVTLTLGKKKSD